MTKNTIFRRIIKMEDCVPNQAYTFTISPNDDYQYFDKEDRLHKFISYWRRYFCTKMYSNIAVLLHIELSPAGRLHAHGRISFNNMRTITLFYLNNINMLLDRAQVEIDTIEDEEKWDNYCTKQADYFNGCNRTINNLKDRYRDDVKCEIEYIKIPLRDKDEINM